ncbi:MAG: cell division protein FtsL [Pseudomonadota bacterium]
MRVLATLLGALAVIGLGYWAYHQSVETKAALAEIDRLNGQIELQKERLEVLRDEWAYLTRPDRLRALAEIDFERLQLLPMTPEQFADVREIPHPPSQADLLLSDLVDAYQGSASAAEATQ